jgi:uncharacterized protein YndB with AHSA1/START domain
MRSARHGEVRAHVDAPLHKVWALLANLDQMGQWSPECYRVQWLDGASSPATPGARFKCWNRFGWMRWTMTCQVKTAEPGRELTFSTIAKDRELVRWRYLLEPASGGADSSSHSRSSGCPSPHGWVRTCSCATATSAARKRCARP